MNTITLLEGYEYPVTKIVPKPEGKLDFPYQHDYIVCPLNSLEDIFSAIGQNRKNPYAYFIRGVPHTFKGRNGSFIRQIEYTTDTPLPWIMLDIDGWKKDKPLKDKLIELLPFVNQETAMLIDYSSKEGVFGCGKDYRDKYYAHVFLWCDKAFTSQDWHDRLIQYEGLIDCHLFNVVQAHFFAEPTLLEGFQTELTERTIFLDGDSFSADDVPLPKIFTKTFQTTSHKGVKSETIEEAYEDIFRPNPYTNKVERHFGVHRFFCKVVAKGEDQTYWIKRYWNDSRKRKEDNSIEVVKKAMDDAKEYVYRKFTNQFEPHYKVFHIDEENLKEFMNYELGKNYLIKSPQMTWKTQSLKNIPKTITENGKARATKIWVVGHRVNLIRQMCKELNLKLYCDLPEFIEEEINDKTYKKPYPLWKENRLGITFDSFWRTFDENQATEVDYLILDESEQVIMELLTTTRTQELSPGYEYKKLQLTSQLRSNIGRAIQASKSLIALDADLGDLTQWFIEDWKTDNLSIYWNKHQSLKGRIVKLMPSLEYNLDCIERDIAQGKRVYINCDSKFKAEAIHKHLEATFDPISQRKGRWEKGIIIHGGNSSLNLHVEIARNPNQKIPELIRRGLKWLITTPVFETGISIGTNELYDYRFHSAYALWTWNNYTANTLRQAICRVRNADNYYVYIPNKFGIPTDISTILEHVEQQRNEPRHLDRTEYLKRYVEQRKEDSQSNKVIHFQFLMEEIGVILERMDKDSAVGSSAWNFAMRALTEEKKENILKATNVRNEKEYQALGFTEADQYRRWKYEVQKAFDTREIDRQLIERWNFGRIEQRWNLRRLLQRNIEALEQAEMEKKLCDSKQTPFIYEAFERLFDDFDISPEQHRETDKRRLFFKEHINQKTLDWLCKDNVLKALKHILKWHGLELYEVEKLKAEPLRFYRKLAYLACYGVTHFGAYDGRLKKGKALKINDVIKDYKKRGMFEKLPKGKTKLNKITKEILEERIFARAKDLSETEIDFYRYRNPHLILVDYEPNYTAYFGKNLSDPNLHIEENLSDKKIRQKEAVGGY